jgi:hypothetical protein
VAETELLCPYPPGARLPLRIAVLLEQLASQIGDVRDLPRLYRALIGDLVIRVNTGVRFILERLDEVH